MAADAGALMLVDAVQAAGKLSLPPVGDLIALSAHKMYGPKGIGALWIRDGVAIRPLIHGGGQEPAGRSGTLSPALCAGFGAAARLSITEMGADAERLDRLFRLFLDRLGPEWTLNGSATDRWHGNLNVRHAGLDVARLMSTLRHIAFSAGSACASGSGRPSHVLKAIGLDDAAARSSIRIGLGRMTSEEEVMTATGDILDAVRAQRVAA
jgi:cysteine desulfurase